MKTSAPGKPLVSIVTVVLDRAATIERAVRSVAGQSYGNIEYLVIDGGSKDGTLDILKRHGASIDRLVSEPDGGMYHALNKGIALSTGDLVGIVHSDDFLWDRDVVKNLVAAVLKSEGDLFHGDACFVRETDRLCTFDRMSSDAGRVLETPAGMIHPATFVKKEVFEKAGPYDTRYRSAADYEFFIRCVRAGYSFVHVPVTVCGITLSGGDRVSDNCYSHLEAYRFHRLHRTGNHRRYLLSYLRCRATKAFHRMRPALDRG